MDENQKRFNWFVFFSTFARNLIEVFIGTILYKAGFRVHEVVLFHLLMHVFGLILAYPCVAFAKRFSNRVLAFIGILAFVILQLMLNIFCKSKGERSRNIIIYIFLFIAKQIRGEKAKGFIAKLNLDSIEEISGMVFGKSKNKYVGESGFDLQEALNPKEDLEEIMKAFDFFNN